MTRKMVCRSCHREFFDEDYCEFDGTRLHPWIAHDAATAPSQEPSEHQPSEDHEANAGTDQPEAMPESTSPDAGRPVMDHIFALFGAGKRKSNAKLRTSEPELPRALAGWSRSASDAVWTTHGIEYVPISHPESGTAVLRWHPTGSQTSDETYQLVQRANAKHLPTLLAQGSDNKGDFEVLGWSGNEIGFESWSGANASEESANWFLRQSIEILAELMAHGVMPRWVSPGSFVLRGDRLLLVDLNNLARLGQGVETFIPSISHGRAEYMALETFTRKCWTATSAFYSVGVIAAELAYGFAPGHESTSGGDVNFNLVCDAALRKAVQGLLYPNHAKRWGLEAMQGWANGNPPPVPDWSRLRPGASETAFVFAGRSFHLAADLAEPLLADLDVSIQRFEELLDWMANNPALKEMVSEMRYHQNDRRSADWQLLRLAALLDPAAPRHWRGVSLDPQFARGNLIELAHKATRGDLQAKHLVAKLQKADLKDVYRGIES